MGDLTRKPPVYIRYAGKDVKHDIDLLGISLCHYCDVITLRVPQGC